MEQLLYFQILTRLGCRTQEPRGRSREEQRRRVRGTAGVRVFI